MTPCPKGFVVVYPLKAKRPGCGRGLAADSARISSPAVLCCVLLCCFVVKRRAEGKVLRVSPRRVDKLNYPSGAGGLVMVDTDVQAKNNNKGMLFGTHPKRSVSHHLGSSSYTITLLTHLSNLKQGALTMFDNTSFFGVV